MTPEIAYTTREVADMILNLIGGNTRTIWSICDDLDLTTGTVRQALNDLVVDGSLTVEVDDTTGRRLYTKAAA